MLSRRMYRRPSITVAAAAAVLTAVFSTVLAPSAHAQVNVSIGINTPPPAPIYEVVPGPRPGYVWQQGYWGWDDHRHRHHWHKGRWAHGRPGYVYQSPHWVQASLNCCSGNAPGGRIHASSGTRRGVRPAGGRM